MRNADAGLELRTARLLLRPFAASDHAPIARIMAAPESFEYSERGPLSEEESWGRLLRHAGNRALLGYGLFAVFDSSSGALVGEVGHADFKRGLGRRFDDAPEASWTLAPSAWGRGYALEAATAAHGWLTQALGVPRTVCMIHRDNARSLRLASALGYHGFDAVEYRGLPTLLLERTLDGPVSDPSCA